MQDERQKLAARMTPKAARLLLDLPLLRVRRLEEMRFYAGQNACFIFDGRSETQHVFFSRQDVDELVTALCGYSRYAYEKPSLRRVSSRSKAAAARAFAAG